MELEELNKKIEKLSLVIYDIKEDLQQLKKEVKCLKK